MFANIFVAFRNYYQMPRSHSVLSCFVFASKCEQSNFTIRKTVEGETSISGDWLSLPIKARSHFIIVVSCETSNRTRTFTFARFGCLARVLDGTSDQLFTSLLERPLFFFRDDGVTRTRRIPNVLRIHVRVINSALLVLHRLSVFLSFGFSRGPTFSNIPNCTDSIWGPSESPPTSLFSLLSPYAASSSLMYRSSRVYEFFLRFQAALRCRGSRILRRCDDNK